MIYFDHAAAVPVLPEVKSSYEMLLSKYSGNPEAAHQLGSNLKKELEKLKSTLLETVLPNSRADRRACFFGNDATELLNIVSLVYCDPQGTAWGSRLEHIAGRNMLKRTFGKVADLPLDSSGRICALPENGGEVKFIFITHVQSEIGVMQDLPELMKKLRQAAPEAVILVDMVQSGMFYDYPADAVMPDLLLISGAKLGAHGGAALLAVGDKETFIQKKIEKLRQKDHLISKPNIVQAAALVLAAQVNAVERDENRLFIGRINSFLREKLQDMVLPNNQKCRLTVPGEYAAKNILHFILPGYQAGVLVRMFSKENIMLASGSACQSESDEPSAILQALNYSKSDSYSGIRLSFSGSNTLKEAETFLTVLEKILKNY